MKATLKPFGIVPISLLNEEGITLTAFRVYTALASFQGQEDNCWPSREMICQRAGINSRGGYYEAIRFLKKRGWLTTERRGLGETNVYTVWGDTE